MVPVVVTERVVPTNKRTNRQIFISFFNYIEIASFVEGFDEGG